MPTRLTLLVLLAAAAVPAAHAQSDDILALRPAPSLTFDAGFGPRPTRFVEPVPIRPASSRLRGAWRGAKIGALGGVVVGVAATAAAFFIADGAHVSHDTWPIIAGASVPLTALATGVGAAIGAAQAQPDRVPTPASERP